MKNPFIGYFITTMALVLVDGVSNLIGATTENLITTIHLNTAKKQVEINKLANQQEQNDCRAIGFTITNDEEDDVDEYDN